MAKFNKSKITTNTIKEKVVLVTIEQLLVSSVTQMKQITCCGLNSSSL